MKIKCIKKGEHNALTIGCEYKVTDEGSNYYELINDNGDYYVYSKEYFKPIDGQVEKVEKVNHPNHYNKGIEVIDYINSWSMDFLEGNIIKYVSRYKYKNGMEDLKKAKQYLDWLIEREDNKK